jgi:hypothetical protein
MADTDTDAAWVILGTLAVVGICGVAVIAGLIVCAAAGIRHLREQRRAASAPEQLARAEAIRAEIRRLAREIPSTADITAYQAGCDVEFNRITDELTDVEDLAHRFYEEAS